MRVMRNLIGNFLLIICDIIEFADDKLGILSIEGWICGGKVIGSILLLCLGAFLFVHLLVALAWAIC